MAKKIRRRRNRLPDGWKAVFLKELAHAMCVADACDAAGIGRNSAYKYRRKDAKFRAQWEQAINSAIDRLEKEAYRRAEEGCDEPIYHAGKQVGTKKRYSDVLLIFLLKARRPKRYREIPTTDKPGDTEPRTVKVVFEDADKLPEKAKEE